MRESYPIKSGHPVDDSGPVRRAILYKLSAPLRDTRLGGAWTTFIDVNKPSDSTVKRLVKIKGAAAYLSFAPCTVRKLVHEGRLRVIKLDDRGDWWFDIKDLDQFIESSKTYA